MEAETSLKSGNTTSETAAYLKAVTRTNIACNVQLFFIPSSIIEHVFGRIL